MLLKLQKGIIYGPVHSRRLGLSLGINILPETAKVCPFNCLYCQYGWTKIHKMNLKDIHLNLPSIESVRESLRVALEGLDEHVSYITFSGNGEPTLHPDFSQIVEEATVLRDQLAPWAKTAVLSNSALVFDQAIRESLRRLDLRIMKLDCGLPRLFKKYNQPCPGLTLEGITEGLMELSKLRPLAIQTLVSSGKSGNFTSQNISAWMERIKKIKPAAVQLYTLDRGCPSSDLLPATRDELKWIKDEAEQAGISIEVY
jgi:wyosine [tRNA(Phe)-imidazoG37] synthetase (radical SAM superfamily)